MATNHGLRASETELKSARLSFIQSLAAKQEFESECAVIIPELEHLWQEKIIDPFNLPYDNDPLRQKWEGNNWVNWQHFLHNYDPFLLKKCITRLASRLKLDGGQLHNGRGPVNNIPAYFKALVQDARAKELKKAKTFVAQFARAAGPYGALPVDPFNDCVCLQDEHHRDCPAILTGKCYYQAFYDSRNYPGLIHKTGDLRKYRVRS